VTVYPGVYMRGVVYPGWYGGCIQGGICRYHGGYMPVPWWVSRYGTMVGVPLLYHGGCASSVPWWVCLLRTMVGIPAPSLMSRTVVNVPHPVENLTPEESDDAQRYRV